MYNIYIHICIGIGLIRRHTFILLVQALEPTDQQVRGGLSDEASQVTMSPCENWGFTIKNAILDDFSF